MFLFIVNKCTTHYTIDPHPLTIGITLDMVAMCTFGMLNYTFPEEKRKSIKKINMLAFKSFVIQHKRKLHLAEILALLKYIYIKIMAECNNTLQKL